MALENKKLSEYADLLKANIDASTKLAVTTGVVPANNNLSVGEFVENSLTSENTFRPLSAAQGKILKTSLDLKAEASDFTNVDNTSDLAKPISTLTQSALDMKANLASPALSGTPTAPTAVASTSTTQIASTAFVTTADNLKANIANPVFTGVVKTPSIAIGTAGAEVAVTATAVELNYTDGVTSNIQTQLDTKTPFLELKSITIEPASGVEGDLYFKAADSTIYKYLSGV